MPEHDPQPFGLRAWGDSARRLWWVFVVAAAVLTIIGTDFTQESWGGIFRAFRDNTIVSLSIGVCITCFYAFGVDRVVASRRSRLGVAAVHGATLMVAIFVGSELALLILHQLYDGLHASRIRWGLWRIATGVGLGTMIATALYTSVRDRVRVLQVEAERGRRAAVEAQLRAAQARMHPHFVFNSLNTISALIEEDPDAAIEAVDRLSELLRYSLEGSRARWVSLRAELDAVDSYVGIQKLRFSDHLRVDVRVDGEIDSIMVPPLTLQPLVENAIKHGSRGRDGAVSVSVAVGDRVRVEIDNTYDPSARTDGAQTGHDDLRDRLQALYSGDAEFTTLDEGGRYRVVLSLPRSTEDPP